MELKKEIIHKLIEAALSSRKKAYAPYSKFKVGAALLTSSGQIYIGANVENASYGLSLCAERVAIAKAVSEGEKKFNALALIYEGKDYPVPCGACRQFIYEFGDKINIIMAKSKDKYIIKNIRELLPKAFRL